MLSRLQTVAEIKIAIVGDVHDQWQVDDAVALRFLDVDLVLFVGDFGDESIDVVRAIANLDFPKAIVLGNHDAWYAVRKKPRASDKDGVDIQLAILGDAHVGFRYLDFPQLGLSVVGARPFSWGGQKWKNTNFYGDRFGVRSFAESTARIMQSVQSCTYENIIFLGHNGAAGLGDQPWDICGIDWQSHGGDYGDPDLAEAITTTQKLGKNVVLVAFGHMHHRVKTHPNRSRTSVVSDRSYQTLYVNAACVPRIIENRHNFTLVTLENYRVKTVNLVWVHPELGIVAQQQTWPHQSSNGNWGAG